MRRDRWTLIGTCASLALAAAFAGNAAVQNVPAAAPGVPAAAPGVPAAAPGVPAAAPGQVDAPQTVNPKSPADAERVRQAISNTATRPTKDQAGAPVKGAPQAKAPLELAPAQVANPSEAPVLEFVPPIADMGEMAADTAKTMTVKLKNVSSEPIRITKAIPACGCTTPTWPKDPIPPGGTGDCEITLKPGSAQGIRLSKKVTFQIENHNPVVLTVEGNVVAYVTMLPSMLESPSEEAAAANPTGTITLESADGVAFKVTEVSPPVVKNMPTDAALKHVLAVNWADWEAAGRSPKIMIKTDNPKAASLTMLVKRSMGKNAPSAPEGPKAPAGPGTTDLINAIRSGDMAKVSAVLASGADVNERDRAGQKTGLHWAAKTGNRAALEALIAAKADVNIKDRQGRTALWSGVETDLETVKFLIDSGADVNARDLINSTPLLWASGFGKPETVAFLISKGADVKATDDNGWTPLIWAAGLGQPMTVDILVKANADLTVADKQTGDTPLLRGARTGKPESLKILVDAGADVKVTNKAGQTALHLAAASGSADKVALLLAAKADANAIDQKGWAPIDYAMNRTTGDKTKLLEVLKPVSPEPKATTTPAGQ